MSLRKFFLKSNFTYKIYLIYNLFIKHKIFLRRKSYSQFGEDLTIINFFKNTKKGKYLDIGCFHPSMYSNTLLLYQKGWSGMNIDLNQTTIDLFNIARSKDINLCRVIGDEEKMVKVYFDGHFSPVNTIEERFYNEHRKKFFKNGFTREVMCQKLNNIFNENNISKIDFINIDAEGMDYKILQQINLNKIKVRLLAIETHYFDGKQTEDYSSILAYLRENGFLFLKKYGPTSLFCKN